MEKKMVVTMNGDLINFEASDELSLSDEVLMLVGGLTAITLQGNPENADEMIELIYHTLRGWVHREKDRSADNVEVSQ